MPDPAPMDAVPTPATASPPWLDLVLSLDLEVTLAGRLLKLGALLGPRSITAPPHQALQALEPLARSARCVLGHNIVAHDLPRIALSSPTHAVLQLPAIDTLVLSPLCFPRNPYHALVKDEKLVRESANDPVADARQALRVFTDEWQALARLHQRAPDLFLLLHLLLTAPGSTAPAHGPDADIPDNERERAGMDLVFASIGGPAPGATAARDLATRWIRRFACQSATVPDAALDTRRGRLALTYAAAWLEVAGESSVLPPWVRSKHPDAARWLRLWRCQPCNSPACSYCRTEHNAVAQLRHWFRYDAFRPVPAAPDGSSLQQRIVEAGMRDESLLAVLPTGGGKSICFQLPALVRHRRLGSLTVVISPLQALMKDQVDGLVRRTDTPAAAALYGLLTPPERADVLRRITRGDIALLYVSPEQFRNRSFATAIATREIGCWVFDEAHCLSKWGHDFRPDYLYAARFIREFSARARVPVAPIACLTATAKREVSAEILEHFERETGRTLRTFEGGVERTNLHFHVEETGIHAKNRQVDELLHSRLQLGGSGSAVVFRARRATTEQTARFLRDRGWSCEHFHAGLTPPEKKRIQDDFIAGRIQVICATNAFGMGIDKDDVRLVIHADTPGSLENYLQEAGRAGRDGLDADCILLFDEEDCEAQFRLGALHELHRRDIAQILRGIRRASRGRDEVVLTTGELLRDDIEASIDPAAASADTQVRTAIAWLEKAGFVSREENVTSVFSAVPLVRTLEDAERRIAPLNLAPHHSALWLALLQALMNAGPADNLTLDGLALLPQMKPFLQERNHASPNPAAISAHVLRTFDAMADAGLIKRDTRLNAFVRHKVQDHSELRLQRVDRLEHRLIELLVEIEPDAGSDPDAWLQLSLRLLNQRLLDEGFDTSLQQVRRVVFSLSQDGRGLADRMGSLDLRTQGHDTLAVRVRRTWATVRELAARRRRAAHLVLQRIYANIPPDAPIRNDLLVEFSFEQLRETLDQDLEIRSASPDLNATAERALLYLHEQEVIELRQGLAIFRSAMTLRIVANRNGQQYTNNDFQPLAAHYRERILQIHVMGEYARRGLDGMNDALELVSAYFRLRREEFVARYVPLKPAVREHATTAASYERIVSDLENPDQIRIVTAPVSRNLLILAGPGSGKTRTVVHRAAYLLRVLRVRASSILICCFNRAAALELRKRLAQLAGEDARGVTILTYHALALRLLGRTLDSSGAEPDFKSLIRDAVALLRGQKLPPGLEADDVRDRLLSGFHHILVDEYQDIDADQYDLIGALAGRTLDDPDQKLSILAVGDDDQSIYGFRGANVEFIRRFREDYDAEVHHLVENHRSTRRIIDAANAVIAVNLDRMKTGHPIRIDRHRRDHPVGGPLESLDPVTRGRVHVVAVPDASCQALAALAELRRLHALRQGPWERFAVLSSQHHDLALVRAALEQAGIPVRWRAANALPHLSRIREIDDFLQRLDAARHQSIPPTRLREWIPVPPSGTQNPWLKLLHDLVDAWQDEAGEAETPVHAAARFLRETLAELRRDASHADGVVLSTVHAAKGTEYDHVLLVGPWPAQTRDTEEQRRAFYVGMTRARLSLTVFDLESVRPSLPGQLIQPGYHRTRPVPSGDVLEHRSYDILSLADLNLGFAGHHPATHPIHARLARLQPGDLVTLDAVHPARLTVVDARQEPVAQLSARASETWRPRLAHLREIRVLGLYRRRKSDESPDPTAPKPHPAPALVDSWELPLLEIVWRKP